MKFDLDIYNHKGMSDYSILPSEENRNYIYILSNNQTLASEVYNEIITSYNLNKHFTTDDFNEVIDQLSGDCRAEFKKSDFLLAVYNAGGCFIAQTGKTRAIQVRPDDQEIVFDSRNLVLDIYNSKARVSQLTDYKQGDLLLLCSQEDIDAKAIRRILSNPELSTQAKNDQLKQMKELANACYVLINATNVKASFSLSLLKKIRFKYVAYALLICAIAGVVAWMVTCNPFKGGDDATVVDEDTLVSVNSPHNADTTVKVVTETPTIAPKDSIKAALVAKGVKKEKKEVTEKIEETPITEVSNADSKKSVDAEKAPAVKSEPKHEAPTATPDPAPAAPAGE